MYLTRLKAQIASVFMTESHTFERLVASSYDSTLFAIFDISPEHALEHLFMYSFFLTHRTILDFSHNFHIPPLV